MAPAPASLVTANSAQSNGQWQEEPMLQLITTSHPWIGGTINGSMSVYNASKNYSPSFIRSSVEFAERNIGSPMVNTVGAGLNLVGVESRVRRYLGDRRLSDSDHDRKGRKRRRANTPPEGEADLEKGMPSPKLPLERARAGSQSSYAESLPAYDDKRSPAYEERGALVTSERPHDQQQRPRSPHSWSTHIMITTSGLGVALHDQSLRSLKFTLTVLRDASTRIGDIMQALRMLLEDYERTVGPSQTESNAANGQQQPLTPQQEEASRRIADRIKQLGQDIWQTLRAVVESVSRYTGGALPENAGALVRRQLMSLPHRWLSAGQTSAQRSSTNSEANRSANRFLAFGKESLEMVAQVSMIVSGTISSAEQWLETMGRRNQQAVGSAGPSGEDADVKMVEAREAQPLPAKEERPAS